MNAPMSWIEQFMNWYPRNTRLYRRRSKVDDGKGYLQTMQEQFDELKPFFVSMANCIWEKARAAEREELSNLCQAILQCRTIDEAKALARQAAVRS